MNLDNKKLNIGYKKICDCPENHISCITPKEWIKSQVAIWEFSYEKRDIRDKNIHPAVFPIALPKKFIELLTHRGELILDPFVGIGSTLVAAYDLNRNAIGFDLKKEYVDFANKRVSQLKLDNFNEDSTIQIAINDDARNIPKYLDNDTVSLVITSPPYANMLNRPRKNKSIRGDLRKNEHYGKIQQYSNDPRDLGLLEPKNFAIELAKIYKGILPIMREKAHSVIDITDLWSNDVKYGKRHLVHIYVIEEMEKVGYELRNIIIWDRRNIVNKAGIFGWPNNYITLGTTFEYLLDFWKPPSR